ncbi:MAG: hypothetical protein NUV90_03250 [Candidatus Parcubacteria bacterium]|nr:hypothetical protein [Candidatus Parcubacteria bacterium]
MLLPKSNSYVSGETSIFDTLVKAGEEDSFIALPYQLHTFLVQCLVEHVRDREIAHYVLALHFLRSAEKLGEQGNVVLKRTGDAALLLAGLFPERASRLHVSSSYFRCMGQAAYANLAVKFLVTGRPERGRFYDKVTVYFHLLERVLNAVRAQPKMLPYRQ